MANQNTTPKEIDNLYGDSCLIIEDAREKAYRAVNTALTIRNWLLGKRIAQEKLEEDGRAQYGKQVMETLAEMLTAKYGKGFNKSTLHKYVKFYKMFPQIVESVIPQFTAKNAIVDAVRQQSQIVASVMPQFTNDCKSEGNEIVASLTPQFANTFERKHSEIMATVSPQLLPWTHYIELIRVEDDEARFWYEKEAINEVWSVRTLHRNIASQYYYRTIQSQNKKAVADEMHKITAPYQQDKLEFIKNPVVAEFLGLKSNTDFTESDLEKSVISHLQNFIMEMGKGFAFVGRQQHIRTDMGDFYIDLVFYNYILKCFVLIDLKTSQISHQDVGQMDMYVRMYDKLKRTDGDNPTIGLLLCSETSDDMARYSVLNGSEQIFQAKYLTYLPSTEELKREIEYQKEIFRQQHLE